MRRAGLMLMAAGLALLAAAGRLALGNDAEDHRAGAARARVLAAMVSTSAVPSETEAACPGDPDCLGRLIIPKLKLELPILSNWSYENLKTAPCRYSGSPRDGDLVLLAHNYKTHFGPIRRLKPGDRVVFQDTEGTVFEYQVAATEVVSPSALEEVTAGVHDLTLITCTYGGKTRLVVSCDAVTK